MPKSVTASSASFTALGAGPFVDLAGRDPVRGDLLGPGALEAYAQRLADMSKRTGGKAVAPMLPRTQDNAAMLRKAYREVSEASRAKETLNPDAEWLLDNFYIVEQVLHEVQHDLPRGFLTELPRLPDGPLAGYPRTYALALGLISHSDSGLNEGQIHQVVDAYQGVQPLNIGELWAFPTMLRLGLLENLRRLAEQMVVARHDRRFADDWLKREIAKPGQDVTLPEDLTDSQIAGLLQALRDQGKDALPLIDQLEAWLSRRGLTSTDIVRREHQRQAANQVSIGNCVTSLRLLDALEWNKFFEGASKVEAMLRADPTGLYVQQDFSTRDRCRREIERLARGAKLAETDVVDRVLDRVRECRRTGGDPRDCHLGHYLFGEGRPGFEQALNYRPTAADGSKAALLRHPNATYFGGLLVLWLGLLAACIALSGASPGWAAVVALVLAIPLSELAVGVLHFALTVALKPHSLPKLEFADGIPADCLTFVVIPTMLTKPTSAHALLERLEMHHLSNPDPNLRFALLTDFADAPQEVMPDDEACLQPALAGAAELNAKYGFAQSPRFFVLHRKRLWNASETCWMGWERKRGKLGEFNRLLRGATDTSYAAVSSPLTDGPRVRFVITLDSDTVMPREVARRLVSTIAHPFNLPKLSADGRRVESGHGVLQPRVSFLFQTGLRSRFAKTFAGSVGIDPYSAAVSDVYQDLFGNGTYTGKGVYEVDAFEAATGGAFPPNHVLSHDLIEGNFARCGLVTDVELFDDFPARYHAYAKREHRWIRGDWQLLPWLGFTVPAAADAHGHGERRVPNPLLLLHRWKVFDNLRRSLVAPAMLVFLALAWSVLPGQPWAWTLLGLAVLALPAVQMACGVGVQLLAGGEAKHVFRATQVNAGYTLGQVGLSIAFLANQARLAVNAVAVTLYRLFVSRKHLLVWETAASAEQRLGSGFDQFVRAMWPAALIGLAVGAAGIASPWAWLLSLPFAAAWVVSPYIAFWVSQPRPAVASTVTADDQAALRRWARKTWHFFERFVNDDDHWLPPDNYQEDPRGVVARRTSPTNMGLLLLSTLAAHDFGYLGLPRLVERLGKTFATLVKLRRHRGHFINWYDTGSLESLHPEYVSTVDSGNLLACFLATKHGLLAALDLPPSLAELRNGLNETFNLFREACDAAAYDRVRKPLDACSAILKEPLAAWHEALPWLERLQAAARPLANTGDSSDDGSRWRDAFRELIDERLVETQTFQPVAAWWHRNSGGPESLRKAATEGVSVSDILDGAAKLRGTGRDLDAAIDAAVTAATPLRDAVRHMAGECQRFSDEMDFHFLYNPDRNLFSIGFNLAVGRLDAAHYDLLASECRTTSFLCIARGEIPKKHWFQLGRPATETAGAPGILSWGGTMFEYLMPRLLLPHFGGTLLDAAEVAAVRRQIEYGREQGKPWGISESGFAALNSGNDYMYQSFGVPGLGLKRGLSQDLVVAPYATGLAATVVPHEAAENLKALQAEEGEGPFGMHEAIDYTRDRLEEGQTRRVVKSYMAHHQGMIFLALANHFFDNVMPKRLRAEPMVRAAELLLQERVPLDAPEVQPHAEEVAMKQIADHVMFPMSRRMTSPDTPGPRTHLLSNGQYTVMVTNAGGGYSQCRGLDVTRWREDRTRDCWGQFVYLRDVSTNAYWSAGYQPVCAAPDRYEVVYSIDKAEIRSLNRKIDTLTEVTVSSERDAEVRRLTIHNNDTVPRVIEVTTYAEVVLAHRANDASHPAFGKLFVETEAFAERMALICRRRPRSPDQEPVYAVQVIAADGAFVPGSFQYETDRAKFLGRRRSPANPAVLDADAPPLSGSVGPVLDPVFALRIKVRVEPAQSAVVAVATAYAATHEEAVAFADAYHALPPIARAFELAYAHCRVELRHLNRTHDEAHLFQRLAGYLIYTSPTLRPHQSVLKANKLGQSALWGHGVSGDLPILVAVVGVAGEFPLLRQLLSAHTYLRLKGFTFDLVILNEQPTSYNDESQNEIQSLVRASDAHLLVDKPGGVFVRKTTSFGTDDLNLLQTAARVVMHGSNGPLSMQLNLLERGPKTQPALRDGPVPPLPGPDPLTKWNLLFPNGIGGFTFDTREYVVELNDPTRDGPPAPWANVIAGPHFGCVVTESGGGYTWAENSQANRLTPWSNDPTGDQPGDCLYVRDDATGQFWSVAPLPVLLPHPVRARHGHGYSIFERRVAGLNCELRVSVSTDDPVKLLRLTVENTSGEHRRLSATLFADLVMGVWREQAPTSVITEIDGPTGAITARNAFHPDYGGAVAFATTSIMGATATGDRAEFLGRNGSPAAPAAMAGKELSGTTGAGLDPCFAVMGRFELKPGEKRSVAFFFGETQDRSQVGRLVEKYRNLDNVYAAERAAEEFWNRTLTAVVVETPDKHLDALVNRWLLYQALACRLWGRSAVYQSGGAFGYRDQLQDVLALVYALPGEARTHILRSAARQFKEGDAQHWWHPQSGRGIRSRCSDDYLFLPYCAARYAEVTGDYGVFDSDVPYLQQALLQPDQHEVYALPTVATESGTLYDHCCRALDHSGGRGRHGLPFIGSCDWNDGMNLIGEKGEGESVWLAWFLAATHRDFAVVAEKRGDAKRAADSRKAADDLVKQIDKAAWDGAWYTRAYFDDGTPLGSKTNDECQIDSLPQSWAVLCEQPVGDRTRQALASADEHLVDREARLIQLFDPPFDKGPLQPGYIKGYVAGIRENGGQYTHAATWLVLAFARAGLGAKAHELFDLMNPIRHTADPAGWGRYKVEPYVIAADVYSQPPHVGRGGWTWYTGSASWLYRVAVEGILGLDVRGGRLHLRPAIPPSWDGYTIKLRYGRTEYRVVVKNPDHVEAGPVTWEVDGKRWAEDGVPLADDGRAREVVATLGKGA